MIKENCCLLTALLLFLLTVSVAQAQQPIKVPRIGFLIASSRSVNAARIRGVPPRTARAWLRRRERTLLLSGALRREDSIALPRSRPS